MSQEIDLIKALVLLNIRSERPVFEVIKVLADYFGSRKKADEYYMELYKLVHPYEPEI